VGTAVNKEPPNEEKGQEGRQESPEERQITAAPNLTGRRRRHSAIAAFLIAANPIHELVPSLTGKARLTRK